MIKGAILYFSLTGNTKLASEYIQSKVQNVQFDLINMRDGQHDLSSYDLIGFASYACGWKAAPYVKDYIKQMPVYADKPAFVFSTYGNINGATTKDMAARIKAKGFQVIAAHALNMPENYPPAMKMGIVHADYPKTSHMEDFNSFINDLSQKALMLSNKQSIGKTYIKVNKVYEVVGFFFNESLSRRVMGKKKVDEEQCIKCQKCVKVCPANAVSMNEYPVFTEKNCEGCFACYNACPKQAIYTKNYQHFGHYPKPQPELVEKLS